MAIAPWAKLTTRITPKMRLRPAPRIPEISPIVSLNTRIWKKSCILGFDDVRRLDHEHRLRLVIGLTKRRHLLEEDREAQPLMEIHSAWLLGKGDLAHCTLEIRIRQGC